MEWIEGVKLTTLSPEEIRDLVKVGQEAFLVQLLEVSATNGGGGWCNDFGTVCLQSPLFSCPQIGFFHGDPHPGACVCAAFRCETVRRKIRRTRRSVELMVWSGARSLFLTPRPPLSQIITPLFHLPTLQATC